MQKFILKALVFVIGMTCLVQLLAFFANHFAPDNNALVLQGDKKAVQELLASSQKIEAIAIGNSHTRAIDFDTLGYSGYRLARSGRDLFEVKYYLDGLLPRLPQVKTVFIVVSYFTFQRDNAVSNEVRIRRIHTYTVVPYWGIIKGDFSNFVVGKLHPVFPVMSIAREDSWEGVFEAFGRYNKGAPLREDSSSHCVDKGYQYIATHAKFRALQHIEFTQEMSAKHPNLQRDTYQAMVNIIQQLQQRNIRVVFVTPPYYEEYTNIYRQNAPESLALMKQNMHRLQQEYGVEYYDFSKDQTFVTNHQAFTDSDHLNHCSAEKFSIKLKQLLAQPAAQSITQ